jgi:PAS domain S-box-containing protein
VPRVDIEATRAGAADYLVKGRITPGGLERSIRNAIDGKRAAEALRLSEERYRALVENSRGLICTHDLEGKILSINPAAAQALGYQPEEVIGRNLSELLPSSAHSLYRSYLVLIQRDMVSTGLMRLLRKDGEEAIWEYSNSLQVESGKSSYVLGYAHDVTESKRFEKALRESEERYRDLFENSNDLIQVANPDGLIVYVNSVWKRVLGYEDEEVMHFSFFDIVAPASRAKCLEVFTRAVAGEKIDYFEATFITKNGEAHRCRGKHYLQFQGRPADIGTWNLPRYNRAKADGNRTSPRARRRAGICPAQIGIPRSYESRDSNAHEWRHRHDRTPDAHRVVCQPESFQ